MNPWYKAHKPRDRAVTYQFGAGLAEVHREQLCAWVRENDLDPEDIPIDAAFVIEDGRLTVDVVVRDSRGDPVIDCYRVVRTKRTVPLRTPFPRLDRF